MLYDFNVTHWVEIEADSEEEAREKVESGNVVFKVEGGDVGVERIEYLGSDDPEQLFDGQTAIERFHEHLERTGPGTLNIDNLL